MQLKHTFPLLKTKIMNFFESFSDVNRYYIVLGLIILGTFLYLWYLRKLELFPATLISIIALFFSYHAYLFSREKFRFDLFEKRFEIYEKTLDFCSIVGKYGSLRRTEDNEEELQKAFEAAHNAFRGIGWHKTRALFGEDIYKFFEKLNSSFTWLLIFGNQPPREYGGDWAKDSYKHIMFISESIPKLADIFRPYIYFGDYKKD